MQLNPVTFKNLDPAQLIPELPDPLETAVIEAYSVSNPKLKNTLRLVLYPGKFYQYTTLDRSQWNRLVLTGNMPEDGLGALAAREMNFLPDIYWEKNLGNSVPKACNQYYNESKKCLCDTTPTNDGPNVA